MVLPEDESNDLVAQVIQAQTELGEKLRAQAELLQMLEQDLKELRDEHERLELEAGRQSEVLETIKPASPPVRTEAMLVAVHNLLAATLPKQVLDRLVEEANRMGVRAAAFEVRGKAAWAASAYGFKPRLTEKALRSLVVPLTADTPFREVFEGGGHFVGNSGGLRKNANVLNRLKPDSRDSILLLPVHSAGAVSAILYADSGGSGASLPEDALKLLAEIAGARLDHLTAVGVKARAAARREAARAARPEPAPTPEFLEEAVETEAEVAERVEAPASQVEAAAPSHEEPPPTAPAPLVIEEVPPAAPPPAEAPSELFAAPQDETRAASYEEPPPPAPAATGEAAPEGLPTEGAAELPTTPQGEASTPVYEEPLPSLASTLVVEATAPVELPPAEVPTELSAEPQGEAMVPVNAESVPAEPPVVEAAAPLEPPPAESPAELAAAAQVEPSPPISAEPLPPEPEPAPAVDEAAVPVEPLLAESLVESAAAAQVESSAPIYTEPLPPEPTPVVSEEAAPVPPPTVEVPAELPAPATIGFVPAPEPVALPVVEAETPMAVPPPPPLPEFDLSQLSDADRKMHKAARRLAKLLVSEIELYNKTQAAEGRKSKDLYTRLKRDIERSRQTFEQRYGNTVGKQFDYFHHELVRTLAGSDPSLLGSDYPGPSV